MNTSELQDELRRWVQHDMNGVVSRPTGIWYPETYDNHVERRIKHLERLLRRVDTAALRYDIAGQEKRILAALRDERSADE